ncbi:Chitinase A1 [compost metagenome]
MAVLTLKDSGLTPNTQYSYFVTATDSQGNESLPSKSLSVRTAGDIPDPEFPEWQLNHLYRKEDGVTYEGNHYVCLQEHTSNAGWTPPVAFTLWSKVAIKRRA